MAQIYSSELQKQIIDGAKIAIARDKIPSELADKIIPTLEGNIHIVKPANVVKTGILSNSTSAEVLTTKDENFYMNSATLSVIKDATSTATLVILYGVVDGVTSPILYLPSFTLTAGSQSIAVSFPHPIKIDKNSLIQINADTNVANIKAIASISGYYDNSSKA